MGYTKIKEELDLIVYEITIEHLRNYYSKKKI